MEYFDFYLLHNVYEKSIETYTDPRWGIIDYFLEQKKNGRIRHLGFSSHGGVELLESFLSRYGKDMEFCQIQLELSGLNHAGRQGQVRAAAPVQHPHLGHGARPGRPPGLPDAGGGVQLHALRPEESTAAWAFRFLQGVEGVR